VAIDIAALVVAFAALNGLVVLTVLWIFDEIVAVRLRSPGV
jgi:hypothetical protein